jgi:hypothetical protein
LKRNKNKHGLGGPRTEAPFIPAHRQASLPINKLARELMTTYHQLLELIKHWGLLDDSFQQHQYRQPHDDTAMDEQALSSKRHDDGHAAS